MPGSGPSVIDRFSAGRMTDGYEEIYRDDDRCGRWLAATEGPAAGDERGGEPRPLKPVMSDLTTSGRAS